MPGSEVADMAWLRAAEAAGRGEGGRGEETAEGDEEGRVLKSVLRERGEVHGIRVRHETDARVCGSRASLATWRNF